MGEAITIGLDLGKSVFQVHGVDSAGAIVVRRQLRRGEVRKFFGGLQPCLVGMEACGTAHYWARELRSLGHEVRLLAAIDVKAYVKRGRKNDAADAAGICEAVTRPQMRFVPVKSAAAQAIVTLHRTRDLLVRQRTMLICALRSHLAEFGFVAGQGKGNLATLIAGLEGEMGAALPEPAASALRQMAAQIDDTRVRIAALEKEIVVRLRSEPKSRLLASIPGIGPLIASAIGAAVPDPSAFKSGRQLAAWLGLVPRQHSSGGKDRLGGITKAGNRYIRRLLVIGATGLVRYKRKTVPGGLEWLTGMLARKPARVVTVALANKMARIAWAVLSTGQPYRQVGATAV